MVTTSVPQKIIALRKFEKRERSKSAKSDPPDEIFWPAGGRPEGVNKYVDMLF